MANTGPSFGGTKKIFLISFVLILAAFSGWYFSTLIVMTSVSFLIALIFNPVVNSIEYRGIPRSIAVAILILGTGGILFLAIQLVLPKIWVQADDLIRKLLSPQTAAMISKAEENFRQHFPLAHQLDMASRLNSYFAKIMGSVLSNITTILSSIFSVLSLCIFVPFMTFFFLKDRRLIKRGLISIIPNRYFELGAYVFDKVGLQLGRFVRGWILDAASVGILSGLGLYFLGIQNAGSIGLAAGIGHLVPYFGPVIGGIPAIIISLVQYGDLSRVPQIIIMFSLVYVLDNGLIQPNLYSRNTDFHPLLIIMLILAGEIMAGPLGMLLAVPGATVLKTGIKEIYLGFKKFHV